MSSPAVAPASSPAVAPASPPPASSASDSAALPSPEMASLAFYVGSWTCNGHSVRKNTDEPLRVEVHPVLDGHWLSVRVFRGEKQLSDEFKGYDPDRKKFVHLYVDPSGAGSVASSGWEGDHMTFVSDLPSTPPFRSVFTKLSETSFSHQWQVDSGKGFQTAYNKVCRK